MIHPYVDAFVACVGAGELPSWAGPESELPPELAAVLRVLGRKPRLGQWSFAASAEGTAQARELMRRAGAAGRQRKWMVLAEGLLRHLIVGWDDPSTVRVYLVDPETLDVDVATSLDHFLASVLKDPEERAADAALIDAVCAKLPRASSALLEPAAPHAYLAKDLEPPEELRAPLALKAHKEWLWHREHGILVSLTSDGVRVLADGKGKTVKCPFAKGAPWKAALGPDGRVVWASSSSMVGRFDIALSRWTTAPLPHRHCSGVGVLRDGTPVLALSSLDEPRRSRLCTVRLDGTEVTELASIEHELLPEYPALLGAADLGVIAVDCHPHKNGLVIGLDGSGGVAVVAVTPHPIHKVRRLEAGWLLDGAGRGGSWFRG